MLVDVPYLPYESVATGVEPAHMSSPVLPQLCAAFPALITNHPYQVVGSRTHTGTVVPELSRPGSSMTWTC